MYCRINRSNWSFRINDGILTIIRSVICVFLEDKNQGSNPRGEAPETRPTIVLNPFNLRRKREKTLQQIYIIYIIGFNN
jgi:hypothetical protein